MMKEQTDEVSRRCKDCLVGCRLGSDGGAEFGEGGAGLGALELACERDGRVGVAGTVGAALGPRGADKGAHRACGKEHLGVEALVAEDLLRVAKDLVRGRRVEAGLRSRRRHDVLHNVLGACDQSQRNCLDCVGTE